MFEHFFSAFAHAIMELKAHLPITISFLALVFGIHIINWMLGYRLNWLGIRPRTKSGLIGIPFAPFLHGDFSHLMFNSFPLFMFANFILLQGLPLFLFSTVMIILLSGLLIWLFGRPGIHVGASSLIMGYLGFITVNIYLQPTALSVVIGVVCIYYFGGIFMNLLPSSKKQVSWEGHVLGFLSGIAVALIALTSAYPWFLHFLGQQ